jgi:hypothetical protein
MLDLRWPAQGLASVILVSQPVAALSCHFLDLVLVSSPVVVVAVRLV